MKMMFVDIYRQNSQISITNGIGFIQKPKELQLYQLKQQLVSLWIVFIEVSRITTWSTVLNE